jgi:hypothetical protein
MKPALRFAALFLVAAPIAGAELEGKPTVVPAVLRAISPTGVARGQSVTLTMTGARMAGAMGVYFDDPAIEGRALTAADPKSADQVKVQTTIGSEARIGIHRVFLQTPSGATGTVAFAVGGWPEVLEREPNDAPATAQPIPLPVTLIGALEKAGDVDSYRFEARAKQEVVFQLVGAAIRSRINAVLTLTDHAGRLLARGNPAGSRPEPLLGYRFSNAGAYVLQVRDSEDAGGVDVTYRLNIGEFPVATAAFPLGLRRGTTATVRLTGYNLGRDAEVSVTAPTLAAAISPWGQTMPVPGHLLAAPSLAVGQDPEIAESETAPAAAGRGERRAEGPPLVPVPCTINGRIDHPGARPDVDEFRFHSRHGHALMLEVAARRLGSPLDSLLEVLDSKGLPVERATIRPVAETALVLSNRESTSGSFRIQSWNDLAVNDFVYAGRELLQISRLPGGPDEDISFHSFRGQRIGILGTTPEAHSIGTPLYKVQVYPPGRTFPPNGMPLFRVSYRNDDGGVLYGKDSRLTFDPPADGEYRVRISDVRGQQGPEYAYRLSIHPPRPDFRITLSPEHPNLLRGTRIPISAEIERHDGFDGPVEIRLEGLPAGFTAEPGVIPASADSTTLTIAAAPGATTPAQLVSSHIRLVGAAWIAGKQVVRADEPQNGVRLLTVLPDPDIQVTTDVRQLTLRPGGEVEVVAQVERRHGFKGRVPIDVQNLPFGVRVRDVGLNGVLITEQQTSRRFVIVAEPWVKPQTHPIFAVGRVESDPSTEIASEPVALTITSASRQASR